jgi:hypothetical protein
MSNTLVQCKCLNKFEKETLIRSLNVSILHSRQMADRPNTPNATTKFQGLISDYKLLREMVFSTPDCDEEK